MTHPVKSETLRVPGATLYYELHGSGPVLLMIPGGAADAGIFAGLAEHLADRYTVVPYDPRGNSRSVLDGPPRDQRMDVHGDDAARLLEALGGEPADVLGSSGGAQIGLNLAARHPKLVRTLVAHEPPCVGVLPDAVQLRASMHEVYEVYQQEGVGPGMRRFEQVIGVDHTEPADPAEPRPEPTAEMREALGRMMGNLDYFLGYGVRPISFYVPDVAALRRGPARVVVGVGAVTPTRQVAYRAAVELARRLGADPVTFPGDHGGFAGEPAAFAETLDKVLRG